MARLLSAFSLLLIAAILSSALPAAAQVPVSKEPRHHNVFENAWVRVLDVRIPPGDTSLMHKHETPSVFIVLTNTKTGSQVLIEPAKVNLTKENIWYESFATTPRIHRVWNSDTSEFHTIDMELLRKDPVAIDPPLKGRPYALLFDEKPVRGYRIDLGVQETLHIPGRKAPVIVVTLNGDGSVNDKAFRKTGDFIFVEAGKPLNMYNSSFTGAKLALFELK